MAEGYKCGPCPIGYRGGVIMEVGYKHAMNKQVLLTSNFMKTALNFVF